MTLDKKSKGYDKLRVVASGIKTRMYSSLCPHWDVATGRFDGQMNARQMLDLAGSDTRDESNKLIT
jgi:hypothetical protein